MKHLFLIPFFALASCVGPFEGMPAPSDQQIQAIADVAKVLIINSDK